MKILFTQLGAIGDMILLTPVFRAAREKYPGAEIHVLSSVLNHFVIRNDPGINKIIVYEKTPLKFLRTIMEVRKNYYDYYIDPKDHYSKESRLFAKISKAKVKIGYNRPGDNLFGESLPGDADNFTEHFTERCFKALKPLGVQFPDKIPKPVLFTSPGSDSYTGEFLSQFTGKAVVTVNISASREDKMWQTAKWIEVINAIKSDKHTVVISYAPAQKMAAKEILSRCPRLNEFKSRSINDAISLVKKSAALISVDTSLVHAAAAFDTPLVSLFNYQEVFYHKFRPLSDICYIVRFEGRGVKDIMPGDVIPLIEKLSGGL